LKRKELIIMKNINRTCELVAKGMPISQALAEVYRTRRISFSFDSEDFDIHIQELELSNRTYNALMRVRLTTLSKIIDYINTHGWNDIKNFGRKSATEIFEKILDVAWEQMETEERAEFLLRVDAENDAR
jgi:DNA-directed RNA polymerase alpha subunit